MDRVLKVATPFTAATVGVPLSVPPLGLVPMASVIEAVMVVTVLPKLSWTAIVTAGRILAPANELLGCCVKASLVAVVALTRIALLVPVIELVTVSVAVTVWLPAVF